MSDRSRLSEMVMAFFICTACITLLEGVIGLLFFPEVEFNYKAFFSPPLFGLFSILLGVINYSEKELSIRQVLLRRLFHLLLIEGMVFGIHFSNGISFTWVYACVLALSIALVFISVHVVLWYTDKRSAARFNERLKIYQAGAGSFQATESAGEYRS